MKSRITSLRAGALDDSQPADPALEELIEQVTTQLQAGEPINLEQLAAEHPRYVDQIRELLPAMEMLARLGEAPLEKGPTNGHASAPPQQQLGDFRLIRELGRGGMGVVYEAEQISLGRRVALKVLPFAGMLDSQQLARFKNEARAAATLKHPHIVSVYSVGCERSVHYFAMELVEGQSLAQLIGSLRSNASDASGVHSLLSAEKTADFVTTSGQKLALDTTREAALATVRTTNFTASELDSRQHFRTVARWGIEAAEAFDHAHQNGILHRDIKPANLLVDNAGKLWVTDFGLARMEIDAGMTMSGDLLGTLRYMSPEQVLAKRVVIDHRSDIYSLGATLYELLTLQPPFGETDRSELLKRIAFDEPMSPRKINPRIPVELETIALKALRKSPEQRYSTAHDLADDLRRYLENQPIKAKPPTWLDLAVKWSRRHPAAIWAAVLLLLATTVISGLSAVLIARAYQREAEHRKLAEDERAHANKAFHSAAVVIRGVLVEGANGDGEWSRLPPELRDKMAEHATTYYQSLAQEESSDPSVQHETAYGLRALGLLKQKSRETEILFRQAIAIENRLHAAYPDETRYQQSLAFTNWMLSETLHSLKRPAEADAASDTAIALYKDLVSRKPYEDLYSNYLCWCYGSRSFFHHERGDDSKEWLDDLIGFYRPIVLRAPDSSVAHAYLGQALQDKGSIDEAILHYREAIRLNPTIEKVYGYLAGLLFKKGLLDESYSVAQEGLRVHPDDTSLRHELAERWMDKGLVDETIVLYREGLRVKDSASSFHGNLGYALETKGKLDEAITEYREAIHLLPDDAINHICLGRALHEQGLLEEASGEYKKAISVCRDQIKRTTQDAISLRRLAGILAGCADNQLRDPREAVHLANRAVELEPLEGDNCAPLGIANYRAANHQEALKALNKAREIDELNPKTLFFLAMAEWQLGNHDTARAWFAQGDEWLKQRPQIVGGEFHRIRAEAQLLVEPKHDEPEAKTSK